ncbi:MAG: YitT family protein [Lachnospiraceae bacterium]|nr:YitT family protein [Lachnospiraceae bacterium]
MEMSENKEKIRELNRIDKKSTKRRVLDYLIITVASFIYAVSVSLFLDPNSLAPGGVTGIAIILSSVTKIETGTWFLLINVPIMILGMWKFGLRFILSTLYCTVLTSVFTNVLSPIGAATADPVLATIAGSALMALAMGGIFKAGATTGGTDVVVKVLRIHFPHMKTGTIFMCMDSVIVTISAFVFQDLNKALYAGITAFMTSFLLDIVLYGRDGAKLVYVISDYSETITRRILEELDIGVTHVRGIGAYSGRDKNVIMCVVHKQMYPKLEEIVKEEDAYAFLIVTSATEIYGEGYKNIFSEKL